MLTITPFLRVIWGEWNNFILFIFFVRGKYLLPLKMLTFLIEDWTRGIFFAKTSQNTGFSERLMFLSLKEQKLFCFDFISVFRKQNICQPDSPLRLVRSKSWNILENLEGVSKVSVQTCLWAVLTLFEIMNQWMILSWRPWRVMKKSFEISASFWLWILQIVQTAARGRSKFLLIQDKIQALWNVTWF